MNWRRSLAVLAVLTIITIAVGALANLPTILISQPVAVTLVLLVALILFTISIAKGRRSNPYW